MDHYCGSIGVVLRRSPDGAILIVVGSVAIQRLWYTHQVWRSSGGIIVH